MPEIVYEIDSMYFHVDTNQVSSIKAFYSSKEKQKSNKAAQFRYGLVFLLNWSMNIYDALRTKDRTIQSYDLIFNTSKDGNVKLAIVLIITVYISSL